MLARAPPESEGLKWTQPESSQSELDGRTAPRSYLDSSQCAEMSFVRRPRVGSSLGCAVAIGQRGSPVGRRPCETRRRAREAPARTAIYWPSVRGARSRYLFTRCPCWSERRAGGHGGNRSSIPEAPRWRQSDSARAAGPLTQRGSRRRRRLPSPGAAPDPAPVPEAHSRPGQGPRPLNPVAPSLTCCYSVWMPNIGHRVACHRSLATGRSSLSLVTVERSLGTGHLMSTRH